MKQNVRYGGEEFVIALPNATLRLAITVADHNHARATTLRSPLELDRFAAAALRSGSDC
jgi:PleD family two-component response regulator